MEKFKNLIETIVSFLTPFTWRKFLSLIFMALAIAVALYFSGCHVARECKSFTIVKVDRVDTIRYNSKVHQDYKYYHNLK